MKVGIFGPQSSGKTLLFNAASGQSYPVGVSMPEVHKATVPVPDERLEYLNGIFNPKSKVSANVTIVDVPGFPKEQDRKMDNLIIEALRDSDLLCVVLNNFDHDCMHTDSLPNPLADFENLKSDIILRDMITVENKLERMRKSKKTADSDREKALFEKIQENLEKEIAVCDMELTEDELRSIGGYGFLSVKEMMVVINIDEDSVGDDQKFAELVASFPERVGRPLLLCGSLESEIASLPLEEQQEFAAELGLSEPGKNRLLQRAYERLQLISFFTVGPDEVRAWTIKNGTKAKEAAGSIHSDLERGFIRADVVSYEDFQKVESLEKAKAEKLNRLEGATYIVQDADIIEVRFNV